MLFRNCESCSKIGTLSCHCESVPRFFCESHITNHISSGGKHSIEPALENLTSTDVSSIGDACNSYQLSSLKQAISVRNTRIESLLQEIRRAEEEYSSIVKTILSGPITRDVGQVLSYQALPLFSDSSVVRSLLDLKHAPEFSSRKILDVLNTLNSSLLSSFPSFSFTETSSIQTSSTVAVSVQASSAPYSSSQAYPSQKPSTQMVDPANFLWKLFQQTQDRSGNIYPQAYPSQQPSTQMVDPTNCRWELFQQTQDRSGNIYSIAVSECERYVASACDDCTIKVHELQTLRLLHSLEGHAGGVTAVAFLGNKVVSGSYDKTIKIWEEDRCVNTLNLHSSWVWSVCVSSCKRLVVSGSYDKTAVVFRLEDNKTLHTLADSDSVDSVAFSPNDKEIVSGNWNGIISIWRTETGELLKTLKAHSDNVTCVRFLGKFIVSSSRDFTVKIWDRDNDQPLFTFTDHKECVVNVDVTDNVIASLGCDNRIIVRDIKSGSILQTLQAHGDHESEDYFYVLMGLRILKEGKFIVSGGMDKQVKVWRRVN